MTSTGMSAGSETPQLAQEFSMCDDSDDEFSSSQVGRGSGSGSMSAMPQKQKSAPKPLQNFCMSDDSEDEGAVTPPPPPLSPPRKAPQFFPLPEDEVSEKSASPAKSLRSVHHREGLGFSLCDDSEVEDSTEHPDQRKKQAQKTRTAAAEERSYDPTGLYKLGGARILGKHLAAVHKDAGKARTRWSAESSASSVKEDDVASVVSAVESVAASESSTRSKGSARSATHAQRSSAAARLLGRQLQAVKSDVAVDAAAAVIVDSSGVNEHVDDVMQRLSLRQRQEVQRHIDSVMRSAAERMGYKTLADKQDLCERANNAICNVLERDHADIDSDYYYPQERSGSVDTEWDLAMRAKIRLAMCAARERRSAQGLERAIAAAQKAAHEKRGMVESTTYQDIENRILWAAHEACLQRGGPAVAAEAARMPAHISGVPARAFSAKPRVEIPAGKLDECIQRIATEAKARTEAKEHRSMNAVFKGQRSHPLARAALLNDEELTAYFKHVVAQAASRASEPEAFVSQSDEVNNIEVQDCFEPVEVPSPRKWGGC